MIIRLAGNPFIRHMPSYVHLFFERLPNVVQVDHFRRAPPPADDGDTVASNGEAAKSPPTMSAVYSPRSRYVELEMEVELSQDLLMLPTSASNVAKQSDVENAAEILLEEFDLSSYEEQRKQRMQKWSEQLKGLETRKAELGDRLPTATTAMHSKAIDRARAGTKAAIAQSISHFQQVHPVL